MLLKDVRDMGRTHSKYAKRGAENKEQKYSETFYIHDYHPTYGTIKSYDR